MDAIISFNKVSDGSILAHNKITKFLNKLGGEILDGKESFDRNMFKPYSRIFIVNGLECFCDYRKELKSFLSINKGKKMYWATNDYKLKPGREIREAMEASDTTLLSTVEESLHTQKFYKKYIYVNWNSLTLNKNADTSGVQRIDGLIYYGAFREGRKLYFEKYLSSELYPVRISTTKGNVKEFLALNKKISMYNTFKWTNVISELCNFKYSIYIEDKASHEGYCSPANRFYECISNGVVVLFDVSTKHTFEQAGIDISGYIVDSDKGLLSKMQEIEPERLKHSEIQKSWVKQEEDGIRNIILNA